MLLFLAMSVGVVSAQTSKVTGKVVGEDGEPVIGASIIVKGTTVGTVTDFDGNFELEVPANGKQLVISYIGMKSQEVAATSNVNVKLLADTQNLDEVVVTAMGISKEKKALGYAVQDVKADELTISLNRTSFLYKDRTCKVDKWFFNVDSFKLLCKISSRMKTRKEEDVDVEEASSRRSFNEKPLFACLFSSSSLSNSIT